MTHYDPTLDLDWLCPVNRLCRLNDGLVSRWIAIPGVMGSSKWIDVANPSTGNHGTLTSGLTWQSAQGRPGGFGSLTGFTGGATTTTFVDCGSNSSLNPSGGLTITAWVYPTVHGLDGDWVCARDDNVAGRSYSFGTGLGGGKLWLQTNGANTLLGTTQSCPLNTWSVITATGSAANGWAVYVNGVADATTAAWVTLDATTGSTCIGRRTYASFNHGFVGAIDSVGIYNRALSAFEVLALYNDSRAGSPATLNWIRRPWLAQAAAAGNFGTLVGDRFSLAGKRGLAA